jgi:pentose-5-phosphate-3-epimerase
MVYTRRIAASILACNLARLGEKCRAAIAAGTDLIHFDIMDHSFRPQSDLRRSSSQIVTR